MMEKNLCDTCYQSTIQNGKTYCSYYDKYMKRSECSKFDHDEYKWFVGTRDKSEPVMKASSKHKKTSGKKPKGIEIRDKKFQNKAKRRTGIEPGQENICRFVTIRYEVIELANGKYKHTEKQVVNGLQIKNKVYLLNGKYKMINSKSIKILQRFNQIPVWVNDTLIQLYNQHSGKNQINTNERSNTHDN